MKNRIKSYLSNRHGMSLVEVLTAMALISLVIFCFAPLFLSYLNSINVAGNEIKEVNTQSGIMQTVIGLADTGVPGNYTAPVAEMELELNVSANTTVNRNGSENKIAADSSVIMGTDVDAFKGDFLLSDENIGSSYISVNGAGMGSAFTCFPASLTDDFHTAQITLCSTGFSFNDLSQLQVWNNGAKLANGAVRLAEGTDYAVKKINESMVALSFYGGGKVSFETSPVVVKYGSFSCEIEVDAPSMIMVGEANSNGDYNYYVSRGQVHPETNSLIVIQREMNSDGVTLTSAMNDVEWVPAENSDGLGLSSGQQPYGYYVMCGDNGQIRRFWKDSTTGNYYWGGDYTYHTEINIDEENAGNSFYNTKKTYSTQTEYTYVYHADEMNGFVMGGYNNVKLMNANTFTINALDTDKRAKNSNIQVYIPDGEIYWFEKKGGFNNYPDLEDSVDTREKMYDIFYADDDYDNAKIGKGNPVGLNRYWNINLATDWFKQTDNGTYYTVNGQEQDTNMITLTSVDAIVFSDNFTGKTATAGGPYYSTGTDGAHYSSSNIEYPTSSYTLYCGYIPAVMDVWANSASRGDGYLCRMDDWNKYTFSAAGGSSLRGTGTFDVSGKLTNVTQSEFHAWPRWKGTLGMLAYAIPSGTTTDGDIITYGGIQKVLDSNISSWGQHYQADIVYYPFTNVYYFPLGKVFDSQTKIDERIVPSQWLNYIPFDTSRLTVPQIYAHDGAGWNQQNVTGGQVVDVTMSYLSHPLAIARTLNPTDDKIYDYANNKEDNRIFYWHNSRDSATYLDCASTVAPSGENDINVSLMVGYIAGGLAEYTGGNDGADAFVNAIMNNGIVLLRAGSSNSGTHNGQSANFSSHEDIATDKTGYKLDAESNTFHQFYYLNSRTESSSAPQRTGVFGIGTYHIGDLYGANYWQNNRHIQYISTDGTLAYSDSNTDTYSYLRCHPLSNTKVNCVNWGTTWQGYPEAMWGTENGTLLSWDINMVDVQNDKDYEWNDKSVDAEFQSYMWVDNCNGKTFKVTSDEWKGTVGSAVLNSGSTAGSTFNNRAISGTSFVEFGDKCSRIFGTEKNAEWQNATSFISVLESVNDVCFANDTWVAVGDWSGKDPADYCGTGMTLNGRALNPYTDNGRGGSWVNVKYWVDTSNDGEGIQDEDNDYYLWKAVKISNNDKYNIVQINCLNGMWIATGYIDENENGEQDPNEETAISWTYDPLNSCNSSASAHWRDDVMFFRNTGSGIERMSDTEVAAEVGGINSCATRND